MESKRVGILVMDSGVRSLGGLRANDLGSLNCMRDRI